MAFAGARPPTRHGRGSRPFPLRVVADAQPPTSGVTRSAVFSLFLVPSFPLVSFLVPLISSLFLSFKKFRERERRQPPARSRANCDQNEIGEANWTHAYLFPFLALFVFSKYSARRSSDQFQNFRYSSIQRMAYCIGFASSFNCS